MRREDYVERARALVPALRERAPRTEALRRLPDESFKEFQEAGLLRVLQPQRWGGFELEPRALYEAEIEVAPACGSSAWVLGVLGVHPWQLALFPERAQHDVWDEDPSAQISSSYAPTGEARRVSGGFELRGRWSFSSGCDHCGWVFLGGIARDEQGAGDFRTFLLPRSDYLIDDVWHVAGLAGTGSKDIVVEEAFVPEHRTHRLLDAFRLESPGQHLNDGPLYRLPFGSVFAWAIAAPALGVAQGALELVRAGASRRGAIDSARRADDPLLQLRVAQATAEIDAGRARLDAIFEAFWRCAQAREPIPLLLRARSRFDAADAVGRGVRATDLLFEAGGGHAIFLSNPLQRAFRDVHAMRAHFANNPDRCARLFGAVALDAGAGTAPPDLFL